MKIAILSMQRVVNYGSFFQAYSLKKVLEGMGHQVEFLDIIPGQKLAIHSQAKNSASKRNLKWIASKLDADTPKRVYHFIFSNTFKQKFQRKWQPLLGISQNMKYETDADVAIIGSDEVFNFAQNAPWGFTTQLFGDQINAKKIISYAASFGFSTYSDAEKAGIVPNLKNSLSKLSGISVRDNNSCETITKILGVEPSLNIDPTLVQQLQNDIPDMSVPYKYVLLYSYEGRTNTKEEVDAIKKFASRKGLKVVTVSSYHGWCDKNIIADPFQALGYFKNADYVVTDTFHGTIFSIINKNKFCTIVRDSNSEKLRSLLMQFNLGHREVKDLNKLENVLESNIDYSPVDQVIAFERIRSLNYLSENIN